MFKSYRTIMATLLIILVAGVAMADKPVTTNNHVMFDKMTAVDNPDGRDIYVLTYDFSTGPIDYDSVGVAFGNEGILPPGSAMVGFGYEGIMAEIYHNDGSTYSNWASELFLGCTYDNAGSVSMVGDYPFIGISEGPGTFGPGAVHFDLDPSSWPLPAADDFTFFASADYDDGSGLAAGTITAGTVYVWVESDVVATESASMNAVKAMYR